MSLEGDFDPSTSDAPNNPFRTLYKFARPHTIRGTILGSIAGTVRALLDTPSALVGVNWSSLLPRAGIGVVALLLGNTFITGINQIYDIEIDRLNKPFLPIASGEMNNKMAWLTVGTAGLVGPWIVYNFFPLLLFKLYMVGWGLGAVYSVPPLRTKRNPILAGLTIAVVRGFLLNFGVYYAVKDALGAVFSWSPKVTFVARFMTIFATVIAVTKDLPDVEGDKAYNIDTFATKIGVSKIAGAATFLLFLNYVAAITTGLLSRDAFNLVPMLGGHAALGATLLFRYSQLNADSGPSIKKYYKNIWDLFYLEYVLYTLI